MSTPQTWDRCTVHELRSAGDGTATLPCPPHRRGLVLWPPHDVFSTPQGPGALPLIWDPATDRFIEPSVASFDEWQRWIERQPTVDSSKDSANGLCASFCEFVATRRDEPPAAPIAPHADTTRDDELTKKATTPTFADVVNQTAGTGAITARLIADTVGLYGVVRVSAQSCALVYLTERRKGQAIPMSAPFCGTKSSSVPDTAAAAAGTDDATAASVEHAGEKESADVENTPTIHRVSLHQTWKVTGLSYVLLASGGDSLLADAPMDKRSRSDLIVDAYCRQLLSRLPSGGKPLTTDSAADLFNVQSDAEMATATAAAMARGEIVQSTFGRRVMVKGRRPCFDVDEALSLHCCFTADLSLPLAAQCTAAKSSARSTSSSSNSPNYFRFNDQAFSNAPSTTSSNTHSSTATELFVGLVPNAFTQDRCASSSPSSPTSCVSPALTPFIRGHVTPASEEIGMSGVTLPLGRRVGVAVVARVAPQRCGTRYGHRGVAVDTSATNAAGNGEARDAGTVEVHAANTVLSEQLMWRVPPPSSGAAATTAMKANAALSAAATSSASMSAGMLHRRALDMNSAGVAVVAATSFCTIRGSIPLLWGEPFEGFKYKPKVRFDQRPSVFEGLLDAETRAGDDGQTSNSADAKSKAKDPKGSKVDPMLVSPPTKDGARAVMDTHFATMSKVAAAALGVTTTTEPNESLSDGERGVFSAAAAARISMNSRSAVATAPAGATTAPDATSRPSSPMRPPTVAVIPVNLLSPKSSTERPLHTAYTAHPAVRSFDVGHVMHATNSPELAAQVVVDAVMHDLMTAGCFSIIPSLSRSASRFVFDKVISPQKSSSSQKTGGSRAHQVSVESTVGMYEASTCVDPCGSRQTSIVRVNCLDCIDRTNMVQSALGKTAAARLQIPALFPAHKAQPEFDVAVRVAATAAAETTCKDDEEVEGAASPTSMPTAPNPTQDFTTPDSPRTATAVAQDQTALALPLATLWHQHGNTISLLYAGSNALFEDATLTGKRTIRGMFKDLMCAVRRFGTNTRHDGQKQDIASLLCDQNFVTVSKRVKMQFPCATVPPRSSSTTAAAVATVSEHPIKSAFRLKTTAKKVITRLVVPTIAASAVVTAIVCYDQGISFTDLTSAASAAITHPIATTGSVVATCLAAAPAVVTSTLEAAASTVLGRSVDVTSVAPLTSGSGPIGVVNAVTALSTKSMLSLGGTVGMWAAYTAFVFRTLPELVELPRFARRNEV